MYTQIHAYVYTHIYLMNYVLYFHDNYDFPLTNADNLH